MELGLTFPLQRFLKIKTPAYGIQRLLIHGLGIDRDPIDPMIRQNPQLLTGNRIRPPGLHRDFPQRRE